MLPENRAADESEAYLVAKADEKRIAEEDSALVSSAQRVRQGLEMASDVGKQIEELRLTESLVNNKIWPGTAEEVTFLRLRHSLATKMKADGNESEEDPSASPSPQEDSEALLCAVAARRWAGAAAQQIFKNSSSEMVQDVERQMAFAEVLSFCRARWPLTKYGGVYQIQLFPGTEISSKLLKSGEDDEEDNNDDKDKAKPLLTSDGAHAFLSLSLIRGTELSFAKPWARHIKTGARLHVRILGGIAEGRDLVPPHVQGDATKTSLLENGVFEFKELDDDSSIALCTRLDKVLCAAREVLQDVKLVRYEIDMKKIMSPGGTTVGLANGIVLADNKKIYSADSLKVGLFK